MSEEKVYALTRQLESALTRAAIAESAREALATREQELSHQLGKAKAEIFKLEKRAEGAPERRWGNLYGEVRELVWSEDNEEVEGSTQRLTVDVSLKWGRGGGSDDRGQAKGAGARPWLRRASVVVRRECF